MLVVGDMHYECAGLQSLREEHSKAPVSVDTGAFASYWIVVVAGAGFEPATFGL